MDECLYCIQRHGRFAEASQMDMAMAAMMGLKGQTLRRFELELEEAVEEKD